MVSSRRRTGTTVRRNVPADSRRWKYRIWDNFVLHGWLYYANSGLWGATPHSPGFSSECPSPRRVAIQGYEPHLPMSSVITKSLNTRNPGQGPKPGTTTLGRWTWDITWAGVSDPEVAPRLPVTRTGTKLHFQKVHHNILDPSGPWLTKYQCWIWSPFW